MLPITRVARKWLRKHPYLAMLFAALSAVLISLPQWASSAWALFSNKPLFPALVDRITDVHLSHFSVYWITTPLGIVLLIGILYLLVTGRRTTAEEFPVGARDAEQIESDGGCRGQWLHDMADSQLHHIARHVRLERPYSYEHRLTDPIPSISFKFPIRNHSLFDISIDENVQGEIYYDSTELAEPRIVRYHSTDISFQELGGLSIEQRLTPTEATHISTMKGTFHFSALRIMIKGGTQFPQVTPQRLGITDHEHALAMSDEVSPESQKIAESEGKRLQDIAQRDLANLSNAVFVYHCEIQPKLSEQVPHIDFRFGLFNGSVYDVSVPDSISGYIKFRKARLMGTIVIARNDGASNVGHASGGHFFVRLQLSREEADLIRDANDQSSDYFGFDQLQIQVMASNVEPQRLMLPHEFPYVPSNISTQGQAGRADLEQEIRRLQAELSHIVVRMIDCEITDISLNAETPYVQFRITIINCSTKPISVERGIAGFITYDRRRLKGDLKRSPEWRAENVINGYKAYVQFTLWMEKEDAQFVNGAIVGSGHYFNLENIELFVASTEGTRQPLEFISFKGIAKDGVLRSD